MNIFKQKLEVTFGQMAIYETALISFGIAIGVVFVDYLSDLLWVFGVVFVLGGTYVLTKWFLQYKEERGQQSSD